MSSRSASPRFFPTPTTCGATTACSSYFSDTAIFTCPSQTRSGHGYGLSNWLASTTGRTLVEIPHPTRTCMFCEHRENVDRSWPWGFSAADQRFEPDPRHRDGLNMIFVDGHVEFLPNAELRPGLHMPYAGSYWQPTAENP